MFARIAVLLAVTAVAARAQALTSITSLYVTYASRKVSANPTGEVKARLDSLERDMFAANSAGRTAEVRRLLAKGNAVLSGRPWTDVADYGASLLLRADRVVVESQQPYAMRLEQLYAPGIALARSLSAHATLVLRSQGSGGVPVTSTVVKDFGVVDGVSRDLRESPYALELDLRDVVDGRYVVSVDVLDSSRTLGTVTLPIVVRKGVDALAAKLEIAAKTAPDALRADILYPVDRMKSVNRGRLELRTLDVDKDFAAADAVAAAVRAKKDPFAKRTGDMQRHYLLDAAKEIMPYRLHVPAGYASSRPMPLIVALHGLGGTEDAFFDSYGSTLPKLAEQHGYILVAPLGYRVDGGYGWGVGTPPADPVARRNSSLSEVDVMQVLALVRAQYNIDANRIYLMGHSMGAIGTWLLAPKYPDIWAALGAFSGQGAPSTIPLTKHIPQFVVHGDADPTVNVRGSRSMVEAMKTNGVDVTYIEVPGGNHSNVVEPNFEKMIQFFSAHPKVPKQPQDPHLLLAPAR